MQSIRIQFQNPLRTQADSDSPNQHYALKMSFAEALEMTESSLQKPSQKTTNCLNKRSMQSELVERPHHRFTVFP